MEINLNDIISKIDIPADWLGLREVKETTTYRVIRDGNPQANMQQHSRGIMVEVLADGQFGYYGSRNVDVRSIQNGAEKALQQAKTAAKNPIFNFSDIFIYIEDICSIGYFSINNKKKDIYNCLNLNFYI